MSRDFARAVALLQAGELVAFPTETVYGLGADAANPEAVARIFAAKGRPADHPLIVHLAGDSHLEAWACNIPKVAWELAEAFWPGPLTMILPRGPNTPLAVTGGQETVGVRVPAHPIALELLREYAQAGGGHHGMCGIAAPSANRFGRISPTEAQHVHDELGDAVALILDGGPCHVGIESTIIDLSRADDQPRILRPGHITPSQIAAVTGIEPELAHQKATSETPRVSGSLDGHYAPLTPMHIVSTAGLTARLAPGNHAHTAAKAGILVHSAIVPHESANVTVFRLPDSPVGFARGLYATLRLIDQAGCSEILVEALPTTPAWTAVADRLRRAERGSGGR